mmetsp:Transcript_27761/g.26822  ORF Transcript_27761/g.26822 Transcript_27761/m.26822 type:complete len:103 (-) Transcript_27761:12-320(-)
MNVAKETTAYFQEGSYRSTLEQIASIVKSKYSQVLQQGNKLSNIIFRPRDYEEQTKKVDEVAKQYFYTCHMLFMQLIDLLGMELKKEETKKVSFGMYKTSEF